MARSRPDEASAHFEAALETIEKTRSELLKTDYKLSFLTRLILFYQSYVDALVEPGPDRSRARGVRVEPRPCAGRPQQSCPAGSGNQRRDSGRSPPEHTRRSSRTGLAAPFVRLGRDRERHPDQASAARKRDRAAGAAVSGDAQQHLRQPARRRRHRRAIGSIEAARRADPSVGAGRDPRRHRRGRRAARHQFRDPAGAWPEARITGSKMPRSRLHQGCRCCRARARSGGRRRPHCC